MRALLLDIGNSRLKWGIYDGAAIGDTGDIPRADIDSRGLSVLTSRLPLDVDCVWASNVAGTGFGTRLKAIMDVHCGCDIHFARVEGHAHGVTNSYEQPRNMGVDRWVAMVGAWAREQQACLIADAGTAVTIDALDDDGRHLGGQILPGVRLMSQALSDGTSDIPPLDRRPEPASGWEGIFGNSTSAAVALGSVNAIVGAVERAARTMRKHDYAPKIVLTGGDASRILDLLDEPAQHRPNLVLSGLAQMLEDHR